MRDALKDGEGNGYSRLDRALRRFIPLLAAHEEVEHDLVFPALAGAPERISPEVLESFDREHEEVHKRIGELLEAMQNPEGVLGQVVATSDFTAVLSEHLEQEEATLFPLVENYLPEDQQEKLGVAANTQTAEIFEKAYLELKK